MTDERPHDPARPMTMTRFGALAEAYGGDLDRWPEAERGAARALLAASDAARTALAAAQHFDAALACLPAPPPAPARLRAAVAALKPAAAPPRRAVILRVPPQMALLGRGVAMAAATAAGIWTGIALAPAMRPDPGDLALVEAALIVGEAPTAVVADLMEDF